MARAEGKQTKKMSEKTKKSGLTQDTLNTTKTNISHITQERESLGGDVPILFGKDLGRKTNFEQE